MVLLHMYLIDHFTLVVLGDQIEGLLIVAFMMIDKTVQFIVYLPLKMTFRTSCTAKIKKEEKLNMGKTFLYSK